jgi:hypothetical protein
MDFDALDASILYALATERLSTSRAAAIRAVDALEEQSADAYAARGDPLSLLASLAPGGAFPALLASAGAAVEALRGCVGAAAGEAAALEARVDNASARGVALLHEARASLSASLGTALGVEDGGGGVVLFTLRFQPTIGLSALRALSGGALRALARRWAHGPLLPALRAWLWAVAAGGGGGSALVRARAHAVELLAPAGGAPGGAAPCSAGLAAALRAAVELHACLCAGWLLGGQREAGGGVEGSAAAEAAALLRRALWLGPRAGGWDADGAAAAGVGQGCEEEEEGEEEAVAESLPADAPPALPPAGSPGGLLRLFAGIIDSALWLQARAWVSSGVASEPPCLASAAVGAAAGAVDGAWGAGGGGDGNGPLTRLLRAAPLREALVHRAALLRAGQEACAEGCSGLRGAVEVDVVGGGAGAPAPPSDFVGAALSPPARLTVSPVAVEFKRLLVLAGGEACGAKHAPVALLRASALVALPRLFTVAWAKWRSGGCGGARAAPAPPSGAGNIGWAAAAAAGALLHNDALLLAGELLRFAGAARAAGAAAEAGGHPWPPRRAAAMQEAAWAGVELLRELGERALGAPLTDMRHALHAAAAAAPGMTDVAAVGGAGEGGDAGGGGGGGDGGALPAPAESSGAVGGGGARAPPLSLAACCAAQRALLAAAARALAPPLLAPRFACAAVGQLLDTALERPLRALKEHAVERSRDVPHAAADGFAAHLCGLLEEGATALRACGAGAHPAAPPPTPRAWARTAACAEHVAAVLREPLADTAARAAAGEFEAAGTLAPEELAALLTALFDASPQREAAVAAALSAGRRWKVRAE